MPLHTSPKPKLILHCKCHLCNISNLRSAPGSMRPSQASVSQLSPRKDCTGESWSLAAQRPGSQAPQLLEPVPRSRQGNGRNFFGLATSNAPRGPNPTLGGPTHLGIDSELAGFAGNPVPSPTLPDFGAGFPAWPQLTPVHPPRSSSYRTSPGPPRPATPGLLTWTGERGSPLHPRLPS